MNSKEFEILNEKMNMIFDEVKNLRRDLDTYKQELREKEAEYKLKDAQHDAEWIKEGREHINNYYKDVNNNFYNIERNVNDRYEYRMKDAIERGIGLHTGEVK